MNFLLGLLLNACRCIRTRKWAGGIKTRKSTQGGVDIIRGCCITSWSSSQSLISLSSGENEHYGVVKGASVGLGVQAILKYFGFDLPLKVLIVASLATRIASRRDPGTTRQIQVHSLWVQERVGNGDITLKKIWGGENPVDLIQHGPNFRGVWGLLASDISRAGPPLHQPLSVIAQCLV